MVFRDNLIIYTAFFTTNSFYVHPSRVREGWVGIRLQRRVICAYCSKVRNLNWALRDRRSRNVKERKPPARGGFRSFILRANLFAV